MELIKIAGKDFTKFITVPTYVVNSDDVYISWTDANHVEHRYLTRSKVSGSFTMLFDVVNDYYDFLDTIKSNKIQEGYIPNCMVYCNNIREVKLVDLFFDFSPSDIVPFIGSNRNEGLEINITER